MTLLEKLQRINDKMDLSKKLPKGYFNKYIFYTAFIFLFIIAGLDVYYNNGKINSFSADCPADAKGECKNMFYSCYYSNNPIDCKSDLDPYSDFCLETKICDKKYLPVGFHYGRTDFIAKNGIDIIIITLLLAFCINHARYKYTLDEAK